MNLVQYNLLKSISMIKLSNFGHKCAYTVKLEILQYYAYYYIIYVTFLNNSLLKLLHGTTVRIRWWHAPSSRGHSLTRQQQQK